jgi:hypothetical protein
MPSRGRAAAFLFVFLLFSLLLALVAGEIFVRATGRYDEDGTFFFRDEPIPPFALPVSRARQLVDQYLAEPTGYMLYDADLGWTNRPGSCTRDQRYCANSAGLRSDREFTPEKPAGKLRVSLFGDSFIHGHDVDLPGSLAPQLESKLRERGVEAEVLNFGVGGYGMDQAYLRYSRDGGRFDTDVIVMGLQFENVARHVMVFRLIAFPQTAIPFSKPRYYFDGPSLIAANRPTVAPEKIAETLENFDRSPLRQHESFYTARYRPRWYSFSKLASVVAEALPGNEGDAGPDVMDPNAEPFRVTRAVLEQFRNDVGVTGRPFLLVYLPLKDNIAAQAGGAADPMQLLLTDLRPGFTMIDPTSRLVALAREHGIEAVATGHYTAMGNRAVAEALAEAIAGMRE